MKKVLFTLVLLSISHFCFSQFCIKEGGLYVCDSDKDYVVYEFDGMSANDIFTKAKSAVIDLYVSGKNVTSENEGEILSINAVSKDHIYGKQLGRKFYLTVNYNIVMKFKDGKLRIDLPHINYIQTDTPNPLSLFFKRGGSGGLLGPTNLYVYKKDGSIRYPDVIDSTNSFFNTLIKKIIDGISDSKEDEW